MQPCKIADSLTAKGFTMWRKHNNPNLVQYWEDMHGIVLTILARENLFHSSLFDNCIINCNQVILSVGFYVNFYVKKRFCL